MEFSERGFARQETIKGAYGGTVQVYESSAASGPHIWLRAQNPSEYHDGNTPAEGAVATLHLSLAEAEKLIVQLQELTTYQRETWA